jgi:hypothetical protein
MRAIFRHNVAMLHAFRQGDHICSIYDTEEEQLATAAAYLADGLRRGERVLYVGEDRASLGRFRHAIRHEGFDAASLAARGALIELTHPDAHLIDGRFDCERMLTMLNDAVERALNDGFTGLRTCGDMSWLLADAPGSEQVHEYEALLNQFFSSVRASGMCQYPRQALAIARLDMALTTHSTAVVAGRQKFNPFYQHTHRPAEIAGRRGHALASRTTKI